MQGALITGSPQRREQGFNQGVAVIETVSRAVIGHVLGNELGADHGGIGGACRHISVKPVGQKFTHAREPQIRKFSGRLAAVVVVAAGAAEAALSVPKVREYAAMVGIGFCTGGAAAVGVEPNLVTALIVEISASPVLLLAIHHAAHVYPLGRADPVQKMQAALRHRPNDAVGVDGTVDDHGGSGVEFQVHVIEDGKVEKWRLAHLEVLLRSHGTGMPAVLHVHFRDDFPFADVHVRTAVRVQLGGRVVYVHIHPLPEHMVVHRYNANILHVPCVIQQEIFLRGGQLKGGGFRSDGLHAGEVVLQFCDGQLQGRLHHVLRLDIGDAAVGEVFFMIPQGEQGGGDN